MRKQKRKLTKLNEKRRRKKSGEYKIEERRKLKGLKKDRSF